jgi:glyoxylase-like metal-dependent hydrolase (beta-lactamase superfamily II)
MKFGEFILREILESWFALDGGAMFGVVPKTLWEKCLKPDSLNRIDLAARCLLIEHPPSGRRILVDVGLGERWNDKQKEIYKIRTQGVKTWLECMGLGLEDITDVILTHLHFDHAGGIVKKENNTLVPMYPKAVYHVQRSQVKWAYAPTERDRVSFRKEDISILEQSQLLNLREDEGEIIPGIEILVTQGHTPGHQLVKVSSEGHTLIFCGDLIPTRFHIKIPYIMAYDNFPLTTLEEKKKLLQEAASKEWLLFFEHDPNIPLAKIKKEDKEYKIIA